MGKRAGSAPETVSVSLRRPLGTRRELVLRRPTAAELRPLPMRILRAEGGRTSGATWGDIFSIVAGIATAEPGGASVELDDLKGLAAQDAARVLAAVNTFFAFDSKKARKERVEKSSKGGMVLKLSHPLTLGSEKLERLDLQACTLEHVMEMSIEPSIDELLGLASRLSLQAGAIIDRLDVEDALPLVEVCSGFFEDSRSAGE